MRRIEEHKTTSNPSVFKKVQYDLISSGVLGESHIRCPFCEPNKGCNIWFKKRKGRKPRNRKQDKRG